MSNQSQNQDRKHRSGLKYRLQARRFEPVASNKVATVWTSKSAFALEEWTPLRDIRCMTLRVMKRVRSETPLVGMTVYAPEFRASDGTILLGPGQAESLFNMKAFLAARGGVDAARDKAAAHAALGLRDEMAAAMRPGYEMLDAFPRPDVFFGYREMPEPTGHPAIAVTARAKLGVEAPGPEHLAAAMRLMSQVYRGLHVLPAALFVSGPGIPLKGPAPAEVFVSSDGIRGCVIAAANPAAGALESAGIIARGDDPSAWDEGRRAAHEAVMLELALAAVPENEDEASRSAASARLADLDRRMQFNLQRPGLFTDVDRMEMLQWPWMPPRSSIAPVSFVVRSVPEVLEYKGKAWQCDMGSIPAQYAAFRGSAAPVVAESVS